MGLSPVGARAVAEIGYIFLFPLVANYRTMYAEAVDPSSPTFGGGFDRWVHRRQVESRETEVSSSHVTTLLSSSWLELRAEPRVLSVSAPGVPLVVHVSDLWGFALDGVNHTMGDDSALVVTMHDWVGSIPAGVDRVARCESSVGRCTVGVQLAEPGDPERVRDIQRTYRVGPLSAFEGRTPVPAPPPITWWPASESVLVSDEFWSVASFALSFTTHHEDDRGILARLADVGVIPGARWSMAELPPGIATAIREGMDDALTELMRAAVDAEDPTPVGSRTEADRDHFGRALAALRAMPTADPSTPGGGRPREPAE